MPGPRGQLEYQSPVGNTNNSGYGVLSGTTPSGHSSPFSGFDPLTAFMSTANTALNYWMHNEDTAFNRAEAEKSRSFSSTEAAKERAFNRAESEYANRQNSASGQIESMKRAGLSPGLMYGQMFSTAAQPATGGGAPSGSSASAPAAIPSSLNAGSDIAVQRAQMDNLASLQKSQSSKLDVERLAVEIDNLSAHQRNIADLEVKISQSGLNDMQRKRLSEMLEFEKQQLSETIKNIKSSTSNLDAQTNFVAGAQTDLSISQSRLADAQAASEPSKRRLNNETADTQEYLQRMYSAHSDLLHYQKEEVKNIVKAFNDKYFSVVDALQEHGIDSRYAPFVIDFIHDTAPGIANQSVKTILSWFDGDNWISSFSRWLASKNIGKANSYDHLEKKN